MHKNLFLCFLFSYSLTLFAQGGGGDLVPQDKNRYQKSHFLTLGEQDDWPLSVEAGEVLIIRVDSDTFDPSLEILSLQKDQVLASNDDIRTGEKSAQILWKAPEKGDYFVRVKSYQSRAGGEYYFSLQRFLVEDLSLNQNHQIHPKDPTPQWYSFPLTKDTRYLITSSPANLEILSPQGESLTRINDGTVRQVTQLLYTPLLSGTFYLSVQFQEKDLSSYSLTIASERANHIVIGQPLRICSLLEGGLDFWKFSGEEADLIEIQVLPETLKEASPFVFFLEQSNNTPKPENRPFNTLPSFAKNPYHKIFLLREKGDYSLGLYHPSGLAQNYQISLKKIAKSLENNKGRLLLGESLYFSFTGQTNQILSFEARSKEFDPYLELYSPDGQRLLSNDDLNNWERRAGFTHLLTENGTYFLRLKCNGDGGSGAYELALSETAVQVVLFNQKIQGSLSGKENEVWAFEGTAEQALLFSVRSKDFSPSVRIFGTDGQLLKRTDASQGAKHALTNLVLKNSGRYTIWIRAQQGRGGEYSFRLFEDN